MLLGECLDVRLDGAGLQHGEAHGVAADQRLHHGLAPGAETDDGCVDHVALNAARSAWTGRCSTASRTRNTRCRRSPRSIFWSPCKWRPRPRTGETPRWPRHTACRCRTPARWSDM